MVVRCTKSNDPGYPSYGGRGIAVCERWRKFECFYEDMGNPPGPEYSIDRIDVNGNYEPNNCRWATQSQQNYNRRSNKRITAFGETMTLGEWAKKVGLTRQTIIRRLKLGVSPEVALSSPRRTGLFTGWTQGRRSLLAQLTDTGRSHNNS